MSRQPVSQSPRLQVQTKPNDLDLPRNGQTHLKENSLYRVILVDAESRIDEREADLTGLFCVEWQIWPLQGQRE